MGMGVPSPHTLARSHHPRFSQAQGRGQIIDHFDPDLMRTYQTQYGILFTIGLRRAGIENWVKYAILRVRMSLCLYFCVSENQALKFVLPTQPWQSLRGDRGVPANSSLRGRR